MVARRVLVGWSLFWKSLHHFLVDKCGSWPSRVNLLALDEAIVNPNSNFSLDA
jgi:hypothetical protein